MKSRILLGLSILLALFILPLQTFAVQIPEENVIVTLGEDLTIAQKEAILKEMGVEDENAVDIIYTSNAEEHHYLGDYIPAQQIGTSALSSAKVTLAEPGAGLSIALNNINYITEAMYANALTTAGVVDAEIYITGPFSVSGTGALTGIMKAYEVTSGVEIDEGRKQVANEEMVLTAELAENETVGDEAADFVNTIKQEVAEQGLENEDEIRTLIEKLAKEQGIELTAEQLNGLVDLFIKFKDLNIDWDKVSQKVTEVKDNITEYVNSEEGQRFMVKVKDFFASLWSFVTSLFN